MSMSDDSPIGSLRILHIEANDMDALLVLRCLEGLSDRLHVERGNSVDALQQLSGDTHWDLVLADPYTPNLSVPELLERCRDRCPVLLIAGPVPSRDALSWSRLGLADLVPKQPSAAARVLLRGAIRRAVMCREAYLTLQAHGADHHNSDNQPLIASHQRSQRVSIGHKGAQSQQSPNLFLQG